MVQCKAGGHIAHVVKGLLTCDEPQPPWRQLKWGMLALKSTQAD